MSLSNASVPERTCYVLVPHKTSAMRYNNPFEPKQCDSYTVLMHRTIQHAGIVVYFLFEVSNLLDHHPTTIGPYRKKKWPTRAATSEWIIL